MYISGKHRYDNDIYLIGLDIALTMFAGDKIALSDLNGGHSIVKKALS